MDNTRNIDIDNLLKAAAAEENSALNFGKWKADILSTAQFLEPATAKFENKKSALIFEFTRRHGVAIVASAAALLITFGIGGTLLNRKGTTAPEAVMPQAANIEDIDEVTPELYGDAPAGEINNNRSGSAGGEMNAYGIADDTATAETGETGDTETITEDPITPAKTEDGPQAPATPPRTDGLTPEIAQGAAPDINSSMPKITDEVKKNAVDAIVNTLTLNKLSTNGINYENAEIIAAQHNDYTYGPLVTSSQDTPPKTSGEYEGEIFVVSFTLPDWTIKQYVVSATSYEVLGEVTFG